MAAAAAEDSETSASCSGLAVHSDAASEFLDEYLQLMDWGTLQTLSAEQQMRDPVVRLHTQHRPVQSADQIDPATAPPTVLLRLLQGDHARRREGSSGVRWFRSNSRHLSMEMDLPCSSQEQAAAIQRAAQLPANGLPAVGRLQIRLRLLYSDTNQEVLLRPPAGSSAGEVVRLHSLRAKKTPPDYVMVAAVPYVTVRHTDCYCLCSRLGCCIV